MFRDFKVVQPRVENLVIDRLVSSGLESTGDLKYVTQDDIGDLLPAIQQRKLLDAFKLETEAITLDLQILPSPTTAESSDSTGKTVHFSEPDHSSSYSQSSLFTNLSSSSPTSPFSSPSTSSVLSCSGTEDSQTSSHIRKDWPESFQVPWNQMPADIRSAISDGKRPSPAARRQMQYPNSFADQIENGTLLGNGYTSLLIQVKTRVENLNRNSSFRQHRSSGKGHKRGPTDTYGCTRFQPSLPPEETEETVESKRQKLEEIYSRDGINGADRAEVKQLMETTFYLQRCHINALPAPTTEALKTKWPYLFTQKGLYSHFEFLTDIPVLRTLELAMEECSRAIMEFFKTKPTNAGVREALSMDENFEGSTRVIHLLMAHFSENITDLILRADDIKKHLLTIPWVYEPQKPQKLLSTANPTTYNITVLFVSLGQL
ncbi:uncharacterized protein LOC119500207 isoform X2 [Xyrichtys novacula]|uniref:Uncharacterized protein LOC119500207 isoform X2 n=1 Tax=Xyrichtys novacula TaxID=13765 RepID=A0AAV1GA78_XYRNO|nr:uncharacterized protein LOC119500207 isoform X2 [Xyrichtys novacula]